jgi:PAS domain S-box-containing protein
MTKPIDSKIIQELKAEVSALKAENSALSNAHQRYKNILLLASEGILCVDTNGVIISTNPAFIIMSGYKNEEIIGRNFVELAIFKKSDIEKFIQIFKQILKGIIPDDFEIEWIHKDGSSRFAEIRISVLKSNGVVSEIQAITRDITERKKNEIELKYRFSFEKIISNVATSFLNLSNELLYDGIKRALKEVCQFSNTENGFVFWVSRDRKRVEKYIEFSSCEVEALEKEIPRMPFHTFIYYIRKLYRNQIIFEGKPEDLPKEAIHEWNWVNENGFRPKVLIPLMNNNGMIGVLGFYAKIDSRREWSKDFISLLSFLANLIVIVYERTRSEEALTKSEKDIRNILESSPDAMVVYDMDGGIIECNKAALLMHGYNNVEEYMSNTGYDLIIPEEHKLASDLISEVIENGETRNKHLHLLKKDGSVFIAEISTKLLVDEDNNPEKLVSVIKDITERIKIEESLREAKMKAEEADHLKSAFLANMSHEIRTPMNAILGFAELLQNEVISKEESKEFINIITNSSNNLLKLVDDIIDIAKIESGQIKIQKSKNEVNAFLNELAISFSDSMKMSSLILKLNKQKHQHQLIIHTDEFRLRQIFNNLINNAIKFTNEGYIEIGYKIQKNDFVTFYVKDTGIGISDRNKHIIFDRFRQLDDSSTRKTSGTGLGLTICKNLVNLLGGEIWMESELNKGSTFYFTIPFIQDDFKLKLFDEVHEQHEYDFNEKKILIAEDEESNFKFLAALIKHYKGKPIWAKNGIEAIEIFKSTKDIKLVLLDIQMPEKNGYEVVKEIQEINPNIPVLAQTAYAMQGEKEKCMVAGCDDYISKPIDKNILLEKVFKHLNKKK